MENNVNYAQQYYPPTELSRDKKPLPAFVGPLVLFFAGVFSVLPSSIGNFVANSSYYYTFRYQISINAGNLISNLFSLCLAGLAGFFCYRGFRGALKFMGCLEIGSLISWGLYYILYAILYLTNAIYYSVSATVISILSNIVLPVLGVIFAIVILVFIDILEKKPKKNKNPAPVSYDRYGNPVIPNKKKGFTVGRASIVIFGTLFISFIFSLIQSLIFSFASSLPSASVQIVISNFSTALYNLITLIVVSALAFPLGKGAKSGIALVGCYASSTYISGLLSAFINILLLLIVGIEIMDITYYSLANAGTVIIGNLAGALITIGIVALIHKRKEFSEN